MCSLPQLFTKEAILATTASDDPSDSAEKVLKRQKKQARREAKLILEIKAVKKDLKKAQKKQSKALARLEEQNITLHALEARLEELRAQSPQVTTGAEPTSLLSEETRLPVGTVVIIDAAKMDTLP
jgi:hypothetical protein